MSSPMSDKPLALVTGAARRIGRAIALGLAARGYAIAIHYQSSAAEAGALAAELAASGTPARTFKADFAREAEVAELIPRVIKAMGPIAALVNNASVFEDDDITTMTRESWDRHIETNLRAPLVLSQVYARSELPGNRGAIVNIVDQRVLKLTPQFLSYTVSRVGLHALTHTLAQALAPRIRVNAVAPGPTLRSARQSDTDFARQNAFLPLGHGATPGDVAAAIAWLLEAQSVTGQTIAVDGGQHLNWQTPDITGIRE